MRLSDIKGEQALDVLADIIDPVSEIARDEDVVKAVRNDNRLKAVKILLKNHKKSVIEIMAYLNGENPETYKPTLLMLPAMMLEILNDPAFVDLFSSGDKEVDSSGSPTDNTQESVN